MSNRPKPTTLHSSSHFSRTAQAFSNAINSFDFVWLCFPLCWATVDKAFRERNKRASDHNGIQTFIVNFSSLLDECCVQTCVLNASHCLKSISFTFTSLKKIMDMCCLKGKIVM